MVPKIAISYRRSDSQDITGRIFDRLRQHFGRDSVFRDIDNIRPGIDFRVQISEALQTTDVLLVVMGPKWFGRAKGEGVRINNEADPVRIEVETALQRNIPVIPVLVGNMRMPTTAQLPDSLKDLAYRHAVTVDGGRDFDHHLGGLIRALEGLLESIVDVANSKATPDEQTSESNPSSGIVSPAIVGAVEAEAVPAGLPEKAPPEDRSLRSDPRIVANSAEPFAGPLHSGIPKSKEPGSTALVRLIWPERPVGRFLRVGLIVLVAAAGLAVSMYVAENSRRESQFADARAPEDTRKAVEVKTAEDARQVAAAVVAQPGQPSVTAPPPQASASSLEGARNAPAKRAVGAPTPSSTERFALVIANAKYPDADAPLKEPINDARAIADELKRDGFTVEVGENLTGDEMRRAFARLYGQVKPGSAVLIFFSGYGVQSNRQSYMIPVNAQIWTEPDVRREGLSLETVLGEISNRGAGVKIALIDASRRNPFERRFRSQNSGLAPVIAPNGTLVMYSAALSSVTSDNGGDHSLFVQELLKEIRIPDLMVEETLNRARVGITRASRSEQVPWISSSLAEDFSFMQR
jgi:Caspase domain/TIR domain